MKVSTKFEVDTTIRCLVIALLLLIRCVTLWPWPLTFLTLVSDRTWRVTWSTPPPSLKILRLSVLELWVLTSPIGYHWQCVCSHCACAVSRDLCVGANFSHIFEIPMKCLFTVQLSCATIKANGVMRQNSLWPCVKNQIALCACAKSRQSWTMT